MRPDLESVKQALLDAGVEIYKMEEAQIAVAERVRLHIMDSGVRVRVADGATVLFTARSQQSDFPEESADVLLERVRGTVGTQASPRGYREADATTVEVKDPVDENRVLDVWHEVTYAKPADDLQSVVDEVRWALKVDKYIAR